MATFRNRFYAKRDYESTNIIACVADECPPSPDGRWVPTDDAVLRGLLRLWIERDVEYYGYL